MSCHSTPGNSAVTAIACALTNTLSDEVARRFHRLKSEAPTTAAPNQEELLEWLDRQSLSVRTDEHMSAWRIERLLQRIESARTSIRNGEIPTGPTWHAWQNLRAECDAAHAHAWLAESVGMSVPLHEATPTDIDEQLSALWSELDHQRHRRDLIRIDIQRMESRLTRHGGDEEAINRRRTSLTETEDKIEQLLDRTAPLEAEYRRRGGWSRYFRVVTSGQGHVHTSMNCHTCYPTTLYSWLPALSGKGMDQAVDDYGSEMCSICLPAVTSHPSYRTRGRIEEERRARLDAERAERNRIKEEKGITTPQGTPVVLGGHWREVVKTAISAERTLVDRLCDLAGWYSEEHINATAAESTDPERTRTSMKEHRARLHADVQTLVDALAHKRGTTADDIRQVAERKAAAKIRRANRQR